MARERVITLRHLSQIESTDRKLSSTSSAASSFTIGNPHHPPSDPPIIHPLPSIPHPFIHQPIAGTVDSKHHDHPRMSFDIASFDHLITMGQFIDQVSKLSISIDSIQTQLDQNITKLSEDSDLRSNLIQAIQDQAIDPLIQLHQSIGLLPSSDCYVSDRDPSLPSEKDALIPQNSHQIEHQLKLDQAHTLNLRLNSILQRLVGLLKNERQIITDQIEFEWTKEFNPTAQQASDSSLSPFAADPRPGSLASSCSSVSSKHTSPRRFQALTKLGQDDLDQEPHSEVSSEVVIKRLKVAVRNSTSYPQARQSSIFIQSKFELAVQLGIEQNRIEGYIATLSKLSSDPHSSNRDRRVSMADDSSSISLSLDGLDVAEHDKWSVEKKKSPPKKIQFDLRPRIECHEQRDKRSMYSQNGHYNLVGSENSHWNMDYNPRRSVSSSFSLASPSSSSVCGIPARRTCVVSLACILIFLIMGIVGVAIYLAISGHDV